MNEALICAPKNSEVVLKKNSKKRGFDVCIFLHEGLFFDVA